MSALRPIPNSGLGPPEPIPFSLVSSGRRSSGEGRERIQTTTEARGPPGLVERKLRLAEA